MPERGGQYVSEFREYRYATFYHNLDIVALHARCVVCLDSIYL